MPNNKYKSKTNTLTTPTHTHSQRHAQRVPCLKKSTAFRPKGTNKRNAKEMGKYFSSSYHILFACVRDGSLIKNANANFNDGVKTNVYCLLSQVKKTPWQHRYLFLYLIVGLTMAFNWTHLTAMPVINCRFWNLSSAHTHTHTNSHSWIDKCFDCFCLRLNLN